MMSCNKLFLLFFYSLLGAQSIQLNEIVSSNGSILFDEDGDSPDWIELYNPQEETVDLSGFGLSDDPEELSKWTFPEITVDPGSFLVVFASDKDRTDLVTQWDAVIDWGDNWLYWPGTGPPVSNWAQPNANLAGWSTG
ncbi:MAG TPA: lamin tail domain-containing protein, partial [Candidatus Marinimicrobia bacterium]|nr:lamin tail domain-containing protein [Candidatus Neomarinimicrobiota bacterium]